MSDRQVLANQTRILRNQAKLLANQKKLDQVMKNQKEIRGNQASILANQKKLGVIPADAKLTPRDPAFPAWDTLPANAPKLGRRDAFLSTLIAFLIAEIGDQTQMPLWHAPPAMPIWLRWWRARPSACWRRTRLGVVSIRALLR